MIRRTVLLVARRELNAKLRTRSFVISTAVSIVVLAGFVLMQSTIANDANRSVVGLNGQAISVAGTLTDKARQLGHEITTTDVTDLAAGEAMVADGELDALVSGPPGALWVQVRDELDQDLQVALDSIVAEQVLESELARIAERLEDRGEELDAGAVLSRITTARASVVTLERPDPQRGERLAVALLVIGLLYVSLVLYGTMLAQGVIEEKSSRVVEILLATVRPWQLLAGKVVGLGLVGLLQLAVVGGIGLLLASVTGVLTVSGVAAGTLAWALLWYLLGYFLYASVFAAVGSLVSRQEDAQSVLTPITLVLVAAFVLGFGVLAQDASGTASTVLALLPPFAPILMPGKIALGAAEAWQVGLAILLTLAAIAALTALGGRIYRNAVLHMGSRMSLREALR